MFKVLAVSTLVLVTVLSAASEESRYRLRNGDTIELNFVYVPEFNQTLTIQPDGYITLREIGDIRAGGRSVAELKKEIDLKRVLQGKELSNDVTIQSGDMVFVPKSRISKIKEYATLTYFRLLVP